MSHFKLKPEEKLAHVIRVLRLDTGLRSPRTLVTKIALRLHPGLTAVIPQTRTLCSPTDIVIQQPSLRNEPLPNSGHGVSPAGARLHPRRRQSENASELQR